MTSQPDQKYLITEAQIRKWESVRVMPIMASEMRGCPYVPTASDRNGVLTERSIKALKSVVDFAFAYKGVLSEESQKDLELSDDIYHELKKEFQQQLSIPTEDR